MFRNWRLLRTSPSDCMEITVKKVEILIGDVFKLQLSNGIGFIQCVKLAPETEWEIIRVLPGIYLKDGDAEIASQKKELFFSELPLKYALRTRNKLVVFVGNFRVPKGSEAPRYYRDEHTRGHEFLGWHIVDSKTLKRKFVEKLSEEDLRLSPWGMISLTDIAERIETNWDIDEWK